MGLVIKELQKMWKKRSRTNLRYRAGLLYRCSPEQCVDSHEMSVSRFSDRDFNLGPP
jgi:hypothetical protein